MQEMLATLPISGCLELCRPLAFTVIYCNQEIIKIREWIAHIGPQTKVISLKLYLDIVPSYSRDTWTAGATFSKLQETKWWERHCLSFDFVPQHRCSLHS